MFLYVVNLTFDKELSGRFEDYMRSKHIPDVLSTGKFSGAELLRSGEGAYRMIYRSETREQLDRYLEEDTERLREAFAREFPFEVTAAREICEMVDRWDSN